MKAVILAGGLGTRISEETQVRPKPLIEIGGWPLLWHIMKIYSAHGIRDFVICCGYKGYLIKEYFANYLLHHSDVTVDLRRNRLKVHRRSQEPWTATLLDTGDKTMTGGRLKRARPHIGPGDFCATYGDGLADVDIRALLAHHRREGRVATITAVKPPGRFGAVQVQGSRVSCFTEKPRGDGGWINGGFFVFSQKVFDYIEGDGTLLENEPLKGLSRDGQLTAYIHRGFWQCLDTLRDKSQLEGLWNSGKVPWKVWR